MACYLYFRRTDTGGGADNLLRIVFCRSAIERAYVSFGHQSMGFKKRVDALGTVVSGQRPPLMFLRDN